MAKYYVIKKIQGVSDVMVKADDITSAQSFIRSEFDEDVSPKLLKELTLDQAVTYLSKKKPTVSGIVRDLLEDSDSESVMMLSDALAY